MAITVKYNLIGLETLQKNLPSFSDSLIRQISRQTPKQIIDSIKKGYQGINDKKSLPENELSTLTIKLKNGQALKPMIADKVLTNTSNWSVSKKKGGYIISPKAVRRQIVAWLNFADTRTGYRTKTYKIMELPKTMPTWIKTMIRAKITSFLGRYV